MSLTNLFTNDLKGIIWSGYLCYGQSQNKNFGWNINSEANISCIKQNLIRRQIKFKKLTTFTLFQSIYVARKYTFFYLFVPGNISLIYALVLILLNRKFGLYIRGDFFKQNFTTCIDISLENLHFQL